MPLFSNSANLDRISKPQSPTDKAILRHFSRAVQRFGRIRRNAILNNATSTLAVSEWRNPSAITAPSHYDRSALVKYSISDDLTGVGRSDFLRTNLYLVWIHLHRVLPPINRAGVLATVDPIPTLTTLSDSVACFQGIRRPHLSEDNGDSVLVYVLNPTATVQFYPDPVAPIRGRPFPRGCVLTVQVCLKTALQNPIDGISGTVSRLETIAASDVDRRLPVDFDSRYASRNW